MDQSFGVTETAMKAIRAIPAIALVMVGGCSRQPTSYEDCVLQKVKPGMSNNAVDLVTWACREKFPEPPAPPPPDLSDFPVGLASLITGHLYPIKYGRAWSGNLYNPSQDWALSEVTIVIGPPKKQGETSSQREAREAKQERYRLFIEVPPMTSKDFSLDINWSSSDDYEWFITSPRGHRTPSLGVSRRSRPPVNPFSGLDLFEPESEEERKHREEEEKRK